MSSLVRVLTNSGKSVKHFTVDALTGKYFDRLLRVPGIKNLEVSDPDIEDKLTADELQRMREKFPYLAPRVRKPEPKPLDEKDVITIEQQIKEMKPFECSSIEVEYLPAEGFGKSEPITEETKPAPAKRGRKTKQA